MLDLDRLEVLKGPQGTLFGENSTAGAINCIAAKPSAEFHTGMDLTYGRFHEWDEDAFVSGPLSNSLTARLAVRNESRDGWQISESRSGDTLGTRSRVDRSFISQDPYGRTIDIQGEASPDTPRWQFVGDSGYARPITDRWSAFVGGSISHRTASFAAFGDDVDFETRGYSLVDLRAGIESPDGKWRAQLWGRNVLNQYYRLNVSRFVDTVASTTGMPATFGASLRARFLRGRGRRSGSTEERHISVQALSGTFK